MNMLVIYFMEAKAAFAPGIGSAMLGSPCKILGLSSHWSICYSLTALDPGANWQHELHLQGKQSDTASF